MPITVKNQSELTGFNFLLNDNGEENSQRTEDAQKGFINTARALFADDGIDDYKDTDLLKFFVIFNGHKGRALSALSDSMGFINLQKEKNILEFSTYCTQCGFLQFLGTARDKSSILIANLTSISTFTIKSESPLSSTTPTLTIQTNKKTTANQTLLNLVYKDNGKEKLLAYIVNVIEAARINGTLENKITLVIDRGNTSEPSLSVMRFLVPIFEQYFPERLAKLIVFPVVGASSYMLWSAAKVTMTKSTIDKVVVGENSSCLVDWVDIDDKLERYGGKLVDEFDFVTAENQLKFNSPRSTTTGFTPITSTLNAATNSGQNHSTNKTAAAGRFFGKWAKTNVNMISNEGLVVQPFADEILWSAPEEYIPSE